jgi:hypothetical protein
MLSGVNFKHVSVAGTTLPMREKHFTKLPCDLTLGVHQVPLM